MCPNFPRPPPAAVDPSLIWGYATRELTGLTGTPRSDLMGEDADFEAGAGTRKARIDDIDAAISTRSSHDAASIWGIATRDLTTLAGQPRIDLMGEDADFEAGAGARKSRIDDIEVFDTPIEGQLTADGLEQDVILDEVSGDPARFLEGYIDLGGMQAGDEVVVRQYMSIVTPVDYKKYAEETYNDVQSLPLLYVQTKTGRYGIQVTLQQTVGTYRTFDHQFFRKRVT